MQPFREKITGAARPVVGEYDIAYNTNIKQGQIVAVASGKVVLAAVNIATAILGVTAEVHPGASDGLNPRANGTKIYVYDNPCQEFEIAPTKITATGGTTTTIISTSGFVAEDSTNTFVDDDFNGGYVKLVAKAANSTNTDPIGTVYHIDDHDAGERTLTIPTAGGAVTAGDVFELYPPLGFVKGNLNSDRNGIVYTAVVALPLKVCGYDTERGKVRVYPALHFYK